jgi:hypothetical protein
MKGRIDFKLICTICSKTLVEGSQEETKRTQALLKKLRKNPHPHHCLESEFAEHVHTQLNIG